ncbi:carbohydrate kinase family protein [Clostridium sp. YIM B02505]|uniref:Carbohydrate kinase family protein n=1 Tax=Clostridium yunnanense TaxID=2800325 RepID=A0ABS1EN76_9CLOT|nr:PfkB family carbohydrate kinase [Clostridium yunnanense]MBK1810799.1 carbohydrate kinase family protein [Clostridium yunnanense]
MKKTLIIGSTVLDIIINIEKLPTTTEDCHINGQTMSIGGCAFNVQNIANLFEVPHVFCSPIGTGIYGDYVASQLKEIGLSPFVRVKDQDNGCCYCYVEANGERTFLSYHGAEYTFDPTWLDGINMEDFDQVYICGLEIEESTGNKIISFLKENRNLQIFFAPGPRFSLIDKKKLDDIFKLSPTIHLNMDEILTFTKTETLEPAVKTLYSLTNNLIIVTDGENGSYLYDGEHLQHAAGIKANVVDTIGAGDSHIGAFMASRKFGYSNIKSLEIANQISAKVVEIRGSLLPADVFRQIIPKLKP